MQHDRIEKSEPSCSELIRDLERLAAAWRKRPSLPHDYAERVLCGDLTKAIKIRFGLTFHIVAAPTTPANYQTQCSSSLPAVDAVLARQASTGSTPVPFFLQGRAWAESH